MLLIRGSGDIASGIAIRLFRAGYQFVMTDLSAPTAIRRTVCFSEAILNETTTVEGIEAIKSTSLSESFEIMKAGAIPVMMDDAGDVVKAMEPKAVIDARLAKYNIDTNINDAAVVIGIGPGFTVLKDCHVVIETQRGHYLGRTIYSGSAAANTGIPGNIEGHTEDRILRSPSDGLFVPVVSIGSYVTAGQITAYIGKTPMLSSINGIIRGILPAGTIVSTGMKSGDVDPRCNPDFCKSASDKALAIAGGVLEALLHFGIIPEIKEVNNEH